jgi:uncharacterized protein YecE (DUF72 family)
MKRDDERLEGLPRLLPSDFRHAVALRHASWYSDAVYDPVRTHGVALCTPNHQDAPSPWVETGPLAYLRGQGPAGDYCRRYPNRTLQDWARRIMIAHEPGHDVHSYFDNDIDLDAPRDAERLHRIVHEQAVARQ